MSRGNCDVGPVVAFAVVFAGLLASADAFVVLAAPAAVVAGAAVEPKEVVVAAGAAADVEAGVDPPNKVVELEVEAGAVVVLAPKRDGAAVVEGAAAVVVAGFPKREFWAGAGAGVDEDVVVGAEEAVGNKDAGFEAGAAVLAGVEPPSPPNRLPAAGAVVAGVLAAGAAVAAAGFAPKSEGVVEAGVDSTGFVVAAPPLNKVLDEAPLVLAEKRPPPAGLGAVDAALLNRLELELLAAG